MEFVSLEDFHKRKLRPGEALSVFLHDLKKLLGMAMPTLEAEARKQLLLHQLLAGLPSAVSKQLRATGETNDIDRILERARLLMMMDDREHTAAAISEKPNDVQQLREQLAELTEQVALLSTANYRPKQVPRCFSCNQPGHMQRQCPTHRSQTRGQPRHCYNCGRVGHLERDCRQPFQGNANGAPVKASRCPLY